MVVNVSELLTIRPVENKAFCDFICDITWMSHSKTAGHNRNLRKKCALCAFDVTGGQILFHVWFKLILLELDI